MAMRPRRTLLAVLIMIALLSGSRPAQSCGPFLPRAIFTFVKHPDFPADNYAAGELGVLQPEYARSYLYVAYRYLNGTGFDPEEQRALAVLWKARLGLGDAWLLSEAVDPAATSNERDTGVAEWRKARSAVPNSGTTPDITVTRPLNDRAYYLKYLNCPRDAFVAAVKTLDARISQFGAASPEIKAWVQAQDQVFANCGGGQSVPAPAPADAPALIQADRNYQIAAANFYAANFDAAEQLFRAIASDRASPWSQLAPYLLARTLIRKATLSAEEGKTDMALLAQAEAQLKQVLGDSHLAAVHPAANRMLGFVQFRLNPERHLSELAAALLKKNAGQTLKQDLWDYTSLLDRKPGVFSKRPATGRQDDLTDWVLVFQVTGPEALAYSLQKWEQTHSVAWLVAALSKIEPDHPKVPALIAAGTKIGPDSPAFASTAFHSLRLLIAKGDRDEPRNRLDALLAPGKAILPASSRNRLLSLRMQVARDLDEFLKYSARPVVGVTRDYDDRELPENPADVDTTVKEFANGRLSFDKDAAAVLDKSLPLSVLVQAASSNVLPVPLRREIAMKAWVKAVLLDNEAASKQLVPLLQNFAPELKSDLDAYLAAANAEAGKFQSIYTILKFPALRPFIDIGVGRLTPPGEIDDFRDNWWCAVEAGDEQSTPGNSESPDRVKAGDEQSTPGNSESPDRAKLTDQKPAVSGETSPLPASPDFLSAAQREAARAEWQQLAAMPPAPNYLSAQVINYALAKPDDPRVPEALHLAVKSTRYGCTDKETTRFSKQAFQLLHKRYPKSEWAVKTKYYY